MMVVCVGVGVGSDYLRAYTPKGYRDGEREESEDKRNVTPQVWIKTSTE